MFTATFKKIFLLYRHFQHSSKFFTGTFHQFICKNNTQVEKNNTTVVTSVGQTVYLYCGVHNLGERAVSNSFTKLTKYILYDI